MGGVQLSLGGIALRQSVNFLVCMCNIKRTKGYVGRSCEGDIELCKQRGPFLVIVQGQ